MINLKFFSRFSKQSRNFAIFCTLVLLTACSSAEKRRKFAENENESAKKSTLENDSVNASRGIASWYGKKFHRRRTASGERFDMYAFTAAHRNLPFGSKIKVRNLRSGKSVVVRINDRGPYTKNRLIDLSYSAGKAIGIIKTGSAPVEIETL
jgi:rare lipoprotein A